jgi:hypothetical protein
LAKIVFGHGRQPDDLRGRCDFLFAGVSISQGLVRRGYWRDSSAAMASAVRLRGNFQMRFMCIVTSAHAGPPSPELLEAMHKLATREVAAGRLVDDGGLMPLSTGTRVSIENGKLSILDGPFVEAKEVIGGYAIFELRDKEEAVASAVEFMQLHKDLMPGWEGTCEVRQFAGSNTRAS